MRASVSTLRLPADLTLQPVAAACQSDCSLQFQSQWHDTMRKQQRSPCLWTLAGAGGFNCSGRVELSTV